MRRFEWEDRQIEKKKRIFDGEKSQIWKILQCVIDSVAWIPDYNVWSEHFGANTFDEQQNDGK